MYLYLLKNDGETKSALQQGKFPPEEKIYTLYRYGEPYLKIPVDSKTSVWQAKLPLASLTPRIKDEQSLTLCVAENPIHSSQDLGAHATVSFTVLPPICVLMCSSTTIKQNETLFIRGRVMTPQPLIHFWMFSEKNELFTHQAIIQPDETMTADSEESQSDEPEQKEAESAAEAAVPVEAASEAEPEAEESNQEHGKKRISLGKPAIAAIIAISVVVVLFVVYIVLNLIFPGIFDHILYSKDQLQILEFFSE